MTTDEFRDWLHRFGYTQTALGRALGVSRATVGRWRNGTLPVPRLVEVALSALEEEVRRRVND